MIKFDSFIPEEIAIAPIHPLAAKLELALPQSTNTSFEEIRKIQQLQGIPGVVKRIIPIDADTFWEYWWCVPDRLLLAEDVELMKSDRDRVESILEKLVSLFGGNCFAKDCSRQGDQIIIHDWQEVLEFAHKQGFESYVLDIDYMPNAIKRYSQPSLAGKTEPDLIYIAVEPAHWHVEFLQVITTAGGFEIPPTKAVCSCQIWTAKPYIKNLETGDTSTRYDLWVSTPLDMTQPPWR